MKIILFLSFLLILPCLSLGEQGTEVSDNTASFVRKVASNQTGGEVNPPKQSENKGYFYGNEFRVQNAFFYEKLIKTCQRCGMGKLALHSGARIAYQGFGFSDSDPKRCRNWSRTGYLQIQFQERKLPTKAILSIQPRYASAGNPSYSGEPFSIEQTAYAVNEEKGFEIQVNPVDVPGGMQSLLVRSYNSNHVNNEKLDLHVVYGTKKGQIIIAERIPRLKGRMVRKADLTCQTYTN